MLNLCRWCAEKPYCQKPCQEAVKIQDLDTSSNYIKEKYIPKNTLQGGYPARKMAGGFGRFGIGERK